MTNIIHLVKSLFSKDSGLFQKVRCSFFGKEQDAKVLNIYGISFNPPDESFGIALKINGYGDELFVLIDRPDLRHKDLEEGEVKIGNTLLGDADPPVPANGTWIHFKADGTVEIKTNSKLNVIGNVEVTGTVTATNFISTGAGVDFNSHIHTGDDGGDTGPPR